MNSEVILKELTFKATRSSGAGGQHVNKVSTKVILYFSLSKTKGLSEEEKERLFLKWEKRLNEEGVLQMQSSATRSQYRNKLKVIDLFFEALKKGLQVSKPRKKSKPSKRAIEKRLKSKKNQALKKVNRKPPKLD